MRIHTVLDLKQADPGFIRRQFSVVTERTVMELRGISCLAMEEVAPAKQQIMCSRSFGAPVTDLTPAQLRTVTATVRDNAAGKLFWQSLNDAVWVVYSIQGYDAIRDTLSDADRKTIDDGVFRPMAKFIADDTARWGKVIRGANIKPE